MSEHHITSRGIYVAVFIALMTLTALTVGVTYLDLGEANLFVALGIAVTKALLVVMFFMGLRWSSRLVHVTVMTAILFLGLLFGTFGDYLTRGLLGVPGR
jgi:cytochrome c oxidase subunit IV